MKSYPVRSVAAEPVVLPRRYVLARDLAGWAVFLLGALVISMPGGLLPFVLVLLVSSIMGFGLLRRAPAQMGTTLRWLLFLTAVVLAMSLLSVALFEQQFRDVDNRSRFILLPWVLIWAYALQPRLEWVWRGAMLGLFVALGTAGTQILMNYPRADGWTNAIVFADVTLMLMTLAVLCRPHGRWRWVVAALAAGCVTIVFSGSRGVWLGLICLLGLIALGGRWRDGRTRLLTLAVGAVAALVLVLSVPTLSRQLRVGELRHDMQRYEVGDVDSSAGARIERLKVAWDTVRAHPLTGIGVGRFDDAMVELPACNTGVWIKRCHLGHAHNDFAEWAATQGVPGLALILFVYGLPLVLFVKLYRASGRDEFRGPAAAGVMIVVCYVLCGMTQSMFAHQVTTSFYVSMVGLLTGLALREARHPASPVTPAG